MKNDRHTLKTLKFVFSYVKQYRLALGFLSTDFWEVILFCFLHTQGQMEKVVGSYSPQVVYSQCVRTPFQSGCQAVLVLNVYIDCIL